MIGIGIVLGVAVFVLWTLKDCAFRVEEGHAAVLVRFGRALRQGEGLRVFGPGLHGKWPWDHAVPVSLREQVLDLSGEQGGQKLMMEDGTELRLDARLRFSAEPKFLEDLLFGLRAPLEHLTGLFTCVLRNEVANVASPKPDAVVSQRTPEAALGAYGVLRRERRLINDNMAKFADQHLGEHYGVRFGAVDVIDLLPPEELRDALNGVTQARADAEAARLHMEADCMQRVLAAERGVSIAQARAHASAKELATLGAFLAKLEEQGVLEDYVRRRRDEVLSDTRTVYVKEAV